ncbi:MAG: DUF192 domain-containing protein [Actinomycetota bacterium]
MKFRILRQRRRLELLMSDPANPRVVVEVYEADGPFERARGLLDATEVGFGRGLLLRGKQVHTIGMQFTIDAVYLRRDGTVLKIKTLKPWRFSPVLLSARWILELDGGSAAALGIRVGGKLVRDGR